MGKNILIKNGDTTLSFNPRTLDVFISHHEVNWKSAGRKSGLIFYRKLGTKFVPVLKRFKSAKQKQFQVNNSDQYAEITCRFSNFRVLFQSYKTTFLLTIKLFAEGRIEYAISAENEPEQSLMAASWPRGLRETVVKKDSYSVHANRQGFLLDRKSKMHLLDKIVLTAIPRKVNTGDCYMPLWGQGDGKAGYSAFIEDANDAAVFSSFAKKGSIVTAPFYYSELGKLGYKRIMHQQFYRDCDYNTFAKEYRNFLIQKKSLITIDEKIKSNQNVAELIGTPVIHTNIFETVQPESKYSKKLPHKTLHATFAERAQAFEKFKSLGLQKAYVHLDGWGKIGYDNLHPYVLPPCPEAGGVEGMWKLADKCEKIGYLFGLHDQYRDFYTRSAVYDPDKAVQNINGKKYFCDTWYGGAHHWLCSRFAPEFVARTYRELDELGIKIKGTYLDVFSIVQGDQCFHKEHKLTRTQSIQYRKECFELLRKKGLIVCSEEPGALLVNAIDLVHHAPYRLTPQEGGRAWGTPIPLLNLVYHDCVFVPWSTDGVGGWGIPEGDSAELHLCTQCPNAVFCRVFRQQYGKPRRNIDR